MKKNNRIYILIILICLCTISYGEINKTYQSNRQYEYTTIYTQKLNTIEIQNIIKKDLLNGWLVFTINYNYMTMYRGKGDYLSNYTKKSSNYNKKVCRINKR